MESDNQQNSTQMPRKNKVVISIIVIIAVGVLVFTMCSPNNAENEASRGTEIENDQSLESGGTGGEPDSDASQPQPGDNDKFDSDGGGNRVNAATEDDPPLPGENKPIIKDPEGKTVWDRFRPNRQEVSPGVSGVGGWGNAYWPIQKKKELITPVENVPFKRLKVTDENSNENKEVTAASIEAVKDLFNVNTRDYASMSCGLAASKTSLSALKRGFGTECRRDRQPTLTWEQLQKQGVIFYASSIEEFNQGQSFGYNDSSSPFTRVYKVTVRSADQNGKDKPGMKAKKYIINMTLERNGNTFGASEINISDA